MDWWGESRFFAARHSRGTRVCDPTPRCVCVHGRLSIVVPLNSTLIISYAFLTHCTDLCNKNL